MPEFYLANSQSTRQQFLEFAADLMQKHPYVFWEWVYGKPRTGKQNAALHVFCRLLAEALNERGITFNQFFKEGYQVPWSGDIVKENVWRPMQRAVCGVESSTELTTTQLSEIYDPLNDKLADFNIHVPWPERK